MPTKNRALRDYQMHLMLLEEQKKRRSLMSPAEQETIHEKGISSENRALQDYQLQLMLLEQQKKKRSLEAGFDRDTSNTAEDLSINRQHNSTPASTSMQPQYPADYGKHALSDYQEQFRLLDQQKEQRSLETSTERDNANTPEDSSTNPHESFTLASTSMQPQAPASSGYQDPIDNRKQPMQLEQHTKQRMESNIGKTPEDFIVLPRPNRISESTRSQPQSPVATRKTTRGGQIAINENSPLQDGTSDVVEQLKERMGILEKENSRLRGFKERVEILEEENRKLRGCMRDPSAAGKRKRSEVNDV